MKTLLKNEEAAAIVEYAVLIGLLGFMGFFLLSFALQSFTLSFWQFYYSIIDPRP